MRWLSDIEREVLWRRRRRWAIVLLAVFLLLTILDGAIFHWLYVGADRRAAVEGRDWYRLLRVIGSLWSWVLVALVFVAIDRSNGRAVRVLASAVFAGLIAEAGKVLYGRMRPIGNDGVADGVYVFKGILERFTDPANGMPSSHVAVAFGGAAAVAYLVPRAAPVVLAAAAGCAVTRLLSGAHFATDVYAGALIGWCAARLVRPGGWSGSGPPRMLFP